MAAKAFRKNRADSGALRISVVFFSVAVRVSRPDFVNAGAVQVVIILEFFGVRDFEDIEFWGEHFGVAVAPTDEF